MTAYIFWGDTVATENNNETFFRRDTNYLIYFADPNADPKKNAACRQRLQAALLTHTH